MPVTVVPVFRKFGLWLRFELCCVPYPYVPAVVVGRPPGVGELGVAGRLGSEELARYTKGDRLLGKCSIAVQISEMHSQAP